jgi:hypothetical protein
MKSVPIRLLFALVVLVFAGCDVYSIFDSDDDDEEAGTNEYVLYGMAGCWVNGDSYVLVFDTQADSLTDSIPVSVPYAINYDVSLDGTMMAVNNGGPPTVVLDTETWSEIGRFDGEGIPRFASDIGCIIMFTALDIRYYGLSTLELIAVDSGAVGSLYYEPVVHQSKGLAYGWDNQYCGLDTDDTCYMPFVAFDYRNHLVVKEWQVRETHGPWVPWHHVVTRDGKTVFMKPAEFTSNLTLGRFDMETGVLTTFDFGFYATGDLELSPDDRELWHTDPGWPDRAPNRGEIAIYDTRSLDLTHQISLWGLHPFPDSSQPISAFEIEFLPTGEKAYVSANMCSFGFSGRSIVVIDAQEKEVIKELPHKVEHIIVAKKP